MVGGASWGASTSDGVKSAQPIKRKAAEVLADRIQAEVSEMGWPVGRVLGSEADLTQQYGVSRAVLREAVRLLEYQSVATMRRGPGGGLIVAEPDVQAAMRSMAAYLDFMNVDVSALFEARLSLELLAVQLAAERITETGISRLRSVLLREARIEGTGPQIHDLHLTLAWLSGNPVLQLFIEVLIKLTMRRPPPEMDPSADLSGSHHAHERIVDAVCHGDGALARERLRKHLEATWTARRPAAMPTVDY